MSRNTDLSTSENHIFLQDDLTFRIIEILDQGKDLSRSLQQVCDAVTGNSVSENSVSVRISFNGQTFQSHWFEETSLVIKQIFELPDHRNGLIELFISQS